MTVKYPIKNLRSIESRQKIGLPNFLGGIICGWSEMGDDNEISGLYRVRHYNGKKHKEKMSFYPYVITHTEQQDVNRSKFKNAVISWQALTSEQKAIYNKRAVGRHMFGYHLFLREYMLL
jgi:hypothetical protein